MRWFGGWIMTITGWVRQKAMAVLIRRWLKYWLLNNTEVLFRHLWEVGYPGDNGPELFVALSQPGQRERFLDGLVYAIDQTIKEAVKE